ncbi:hypothetical protein BC567DRAFT_94353 [Phyllosticta citribraziliensis]
MGGGVAAGIRTIDGPPSFWVSPQFTISTYDYAASLTAGPSGTCCTRSIARFSMAVEIPPALIKHAILEAILNLNLDVKDESGHSFFDFFSSLLYQCTEASATTAASSAEELAIELWNRFPGRHKSSSPWTHPPLLNFTLLALYRRGAAWYGWYKPIEEAAMSKWLAHVGHSMPLCVGSCRICEAYSRIHGGVV